MTIEPLHWIGFNIFILLMLVLDLFVFHRSAHEVKLKEALGWTFVWIFISIVFNFGIYFYLGSDKATEFLTGYLIEKSLSVDNIFVFILIFSSFNVPARYQHKVLFWGIISALILRLIFIFSGIALINRFHWVIYVFAAFLVFTGIKMLLSKTQKIGRKKNAVIRLLRKLFRVTESFQGDKFFVRKNSRLYATPLLVVMIVVEISDLIFALDSIPAILAISRDEFIVYTSNAFAILGMRSLYFAVSGINKYFRFLRYGVSVILIFVGIKMSLSEIYKIPTLYALLFIVLALVLSILLSVIIKDKKHQSKSKSGQ